MMPSKHLELEIEYGLADKTLYKENKPWLELVMRTLKLPYARNATKLSMCVDIYKNANIDLSTTDVWCHMQKKNNTKGAAAAAASTTTPIDKVTPEVIAAALKGLSRFKNRVSKDILEAGTEKTSLTEKRKKVYAQLGESLEAPKHDVERVKRCMDELTKSSESVKKIESKLKVLTDTETFITKRLKPFVTKINHTKSASMVPSCMICLDTYDDDLHRQVGLVPCGHSVCKFCSPSMPGKPCSYCKREVNGLLVLF